MISGLISLLILVIVVGIILWLAFWAISLLPMEANFKQLAQALVIIIAVLIILLRALPLLGVAIG